MCIYGCILIIWPVLRANLQYLFVFQYASLLKYGRNYRPIVLATSVISLSFYITWWSIKFYSFRFVDCFHSQLLRHGGKVSTKFQKNSTRWKFTHILWILKLTPDPPGPGKNATAWKFWVRIQNLEGSCIILANELVLPKLRSIGSKKS